MKALVLCETAGCPKEHDIINTVTFPMKEENAFCEAFGHGGEEDADFCPECKRLGVLQEPDLDENEIKEFISLAIQLDGSDDVQFDNDAKVSLTDDRKGVWVQGWNYIAIPEEDEETITYSWQCVKCGTEGAVEVPERGDPYPIVQNAHNKVSPNCTAWNEFVKTRANRRGR